MSEPKCELCGGPLTECPECGGLACAVPLADETEWEFQHWHWSSVASHHHVTLSRETAEMLGLIRS